VIACHDEIVVECPSETAPESAEWLRQAMLDGMAPLTRPVPVEVEVAIGRTWAG
jgi:DNA polymerase I